MAGEDLAYYGEDPAASAVRLAQQYSLPREDATLGLPHYLSESAYGLRQMGRDINEAAYDAIRNSPERYAAERAAGSNPVYAGLKTALGSDAGALALNAIGATGMSRLGSPDMTTLLSKIGVPLNIARHYLGYNQPHEQRVKRAQDYIGYQEGGAVEGGAVEGDASIEDALRIARQLVEILDKLKSEG